jgi:ATP-dependent helicase/DNAse subunit B
MTSGTTNPEKRGGVYHRERMARLGPFRSRSGGALSGDTFEEMLGKVYAKIPEYAAGIKSGDISVRSKGCDHCPNDSVCRFEKWRLIYAEQENIWTRKRALPKPMEVKTEKTGE